MLKRILIPLDSSEFTPLAIQFAAQIAKTEPRKGKEPVSLLGLAVVDTDQIPVGRFSSLVPREELLAEAQGVAEQLTKQFSTLAARQGMKKNQIEIGTVSGSPFREIIRQGVFSDLIVMTRMCSFPPANHAYDTLNNLYHRSSRPVVITGDRPEQVKNVLMVMDGTAPASRMMYAYAHLDPFPKARLKVLYSREEEARYNLAGFFGKVEAYLKSYHKKVEMEGLPGDLRKGLGAVVKREGAQLLALGIPAEQFLDKFRETLRIKEFPVQRLLRESSASLFTVH